MLKLFLAPMEGVVDWTMRDTLTNIGGIDQCVTEFLRVTSSVHGDKIFYQNCPELFTNCKTRSGVPVFIQLLGGNPEPLAANASRAAELGAIGIDFNFGCPAKTVNRHDGGATLLKCPSRLYDILKLARQSVPDSVPITAKIRLGFEDTSLCLENAKAVEEAGANWLTVHCRTKMDGYRPPAYWEWIPRIKSEIKIPVIANGEIWSVDDWKNCQSQTGTDSFMIGRGALSNPFIFRQIKKSNMDSIDIATTNFQIHQQDFQELSKIILGFFAACAHNVSESFAVARSKQWLNSLSQRSPDIKEIFQEIKFSTNPSEFRTLLEQKLDPLID